jgi:hypothetical protein
MFRSTLAIALGICASLSHALETPLTIVSGAKVGIIDPSYGSIAIYEMNASSANRLGLGKPSANFKSDLDTFLKRCLDERDGVPFQQLRVGYNTIPTYGDMFTDGKWFANKPTKREAAAGKPALQTSILRAEDAFWKAAPEYDGVVRAAFSTTGRYLAIAIPSLHALMIYSLDSDTATLAAIRNWGPDMGLTGYKTDPSPAALLAQLPADKRKEAEAALGLGEESKPAADAPETAPGLAAETAPTPKSDVWVGAAVSESFLVVDILNNHAMLYQWGGKALILNSTRNLAVDLTVPGLVGGGLRSTPAGDDLLSYALKARQKQIAEFGLPTDRDEIMLLVGQSASKGKVSPFEGAMSSSGIATLNFVNRRTFLSIDTKGGQTVSLVAARDYTLDIAVALLDQAINDRINGRNLLGDAKSLASANKRKAALLTLKLALSLDPTGCKAAEKMFKGVFKEADQQTQFQALLDEAVKKSEELAKLTEERKKALEEKRNAKNAAKP